MSPVGVPIIAVFNELLAEAKRLGPDHQVLGVIERHNATVSARTLLMLVDQVLLSLEQPPSAGVDG